MDRATSFTRLMARLRDWRIVAYDRRGYAGSAASGPTVRFDDQVADLIDVLDGQPAVAFGHSFGGTVVLAAAMAHPELFPAALVWEPPQPWLPWWPRSGGEDDGPGGLSTEEMDERAEAFMRRMVGDSVWERLPASTRAQRRAEGRTLHTEMTSLTRKPAFDATAVAMPVTVGCGGRSAGFLRQAAQHLAAALPRGELAQIGDAEHGAHLSHPTELALLLRRTADRIPA
jgi:pimeloyl-ACP methyl ester carboxylesterase